MVLQGRYNLWLVALSFVIASLASYASLRLATRRPFDAANESVTPFTDIVPPALALGFGIWAMHFTGMAAFSIGGMDIGYRWDLTLLSLIVAIVFTGFGFATLVLAHEMREAFILAGIPMGCGILTMHYLGMLAMTGDMDMEYRPWMVFASAVIAISASIVALWLTTLQHSKFRTCVAAMAMAIAICGVHYTGMRAAIFTARSGGATMSP